MAAKRYESMKVFKGTSMVKVEEQYNKWYKELSDEQLAGEAGQALDVRDRQVSLQGSGKTASILVVIFYTSFEFENTGAIGDKGSHLDTSGVSAFGRRS